MAGRSLDARIGADATRPEPAGLGYHKAAASQPSVGQPGAVSRKRSAAALVDGGGTAAASHDQHVQADAASGAVALRPALQTHVLI